jgi:signal transduction histidine kinase/ligand-binding sensor domain-containing protein/CheY-like chemotaxis protein
MRCYLLIVLVSLLVKTGFTQYGQLRFKRLTTLDGLSQRWVRCIYQDDIGYMWFGTADGLNRYDGNEFRIYRPDPDNKYSIGNIVINHISKKSINEMWICTDEGLFIYKQHLNEFHLFPFLAHESIQCILEDYKGNLWIGTYAGLYKYNPEDNSLLSFFYNEDDPRSISNDRIRCLFEDSHKDFWIGTENGLNLYNSSTNSFIRYKYSEYPGSIAGNNIWSIIEDNKGRLWIGVAQAGLDVFVREKDRAEKDYFVHIMKGSINSLLLDKNNTLWIGRGGGEGLSIIRLDGLENMQKVQPYHYQHSPDINESLSDNSIYYLYQDLFDGIWIGTYGGGVNYFSTKSKKFYNVTVTADKSKSISSNLVNAFYEEDAYLWIGTEMGLNRLNKKTGKITHFYHNENNASSIGANAIYSIEKDKRGNLWIGSWNGGLSRYNYGTETFINFQPKDKDGSISNANVFSICEDSKGNLWIGTIGGGLNRYDHRTGKFTHYMHNEKEPGSLYHNAVNDIVETSKGRLYISVYQTLEFYDYENDKFIHFIHDEHDSGSISNGNILSIFEDSKKNVWIATNMGLNLMNEDDNTFKHYTASDGLPSNIIQAILEDNHGNLWISTNNGMAVFKNGVNKPIHPEFRVYDKHDGLPSNEFIIRAAYKNEEGKMYFGSSLGYTSFYPDSITDNTKEATVIITDFILLRAPEDETKITRTLSKEISRLKEINLSYKLSDFIIRFTALNYLNARKNQYKYRLDGYEDNWHLAGNLGTATYTNIQPGKYTFLVLGTNNDGIWNESPEKLRITIYPPWWRTTLFKIILALFIIFSLIAFYRIRVRVLERQKKLLEDTVKKRTHQLSELNTLLENRQKKIALQNKELEKHRNQLELLIEERTAELKAAKLKAEEGDRLKSAFLANMSHEIRTPMNAIVGFAALLNKKNLKEEQKNRYIEIINNNSESLLLLISDIIDISLIEADQLVLKKENFNVDNILNELESYYKFKTNKEIDIQFIKNKQKKLILSNDQVRFRQIFNNLISNAYKYTESGKINFGYDKIDKEVRFFVSDTGIGIDPSDYENIFIQFFKVDKERKKLYRGAGLGLAICKKLVERMGGKIWVESGIDKGSVFYFTLPLKKTKVSAKNKEISEQKIYSFKNIDVLIAEDEPDNYELIETILKPTGAHLVWAKNGKEAVEFVQSNPSIDNLIVIMDIKMPVMDGYEAIKHIRKINNKIPVIAITAYAQISDRQRIILEEFSDYISKPIKPEDILEALSKYKGTAPSVD